MSGPEGAHLPERLRAEGGSGPEAADFGGAVPRWASQLGLTRNVVRQALVQRQLAGHLGALPAGASALDVGCGQGTVAVGLAERGFDVVGVDPSEELLARARALALDAEAGTGSPLAIRFVAGTLDDLPGLVPAPVDVVCCHGVLMYLPELQAPVAQLVRCLRPGGLLSLVTRNQAGIAFRAGMTGRWDEVLHSFDARHYDNRVGVSGARADTPEEVVAACAAAGADVEAWYGVRLFTDHWDDVAPPDDLDRLIDVEEEAGRRDPYRRVTSLTHVVARRRP